LRRLSNCQCSNTKLIPPVRLCRFESSRSQEDGFVRTKCEYFRDFFIMKLVNCLTTTFFLLLVVGSLDASRLLAVLVPADVHVPRQHHSRLQRSSSRARRSSMFDHNFYMDRRSIQSCAQDASEDEATFLAMDRICEACHEMYRHTDPNLRANCR
jgi:hypothetical protein